MVLHIWTTQMSVARRYDHIQLPTLVHADNDNGHEPVDVVVYLYLAEIVARKYYQGKDPIRDTDVFSIACQELVKCSKKYNPTIGPFDRFAMRSMRNAIIQNIRSEKRKKRMAKFDVFDDNSWSDIRNITAIIADDRGNQVLNLLNKLSKNDRRLVEEIYLKNKQVVDVADDLKVTRATIYNRIDRIFNFLREGQLDDER